MKIFATIIPDEFCDLICRIGLNPDAFNNSIKIKGVYGDESDNLYYQEIDSNTEITSFDKEDWKIYNGVICTNLYKDPKTGKYYDDDFLEDKYFELSSEEFNKLYSNLIEFQKKETYQNGEIIKTETNEEIEES